MLFLCFNNLLLCNVKNHIQGYIARFLKAKIFLTITDISKIVGYTGLSMRLPPRAAKRKPIYCFSLMEKENGGLSKPPSKQR